MAPDTFVGKITNLVKALLKNKFFLFLLVGGLNTLFGYGLFVLLIYVGFHYVWASLIGTVLGVLFNFQTTGKIVFKNKDNLLIFKFILVYVLLFGIQIICLRLFELAGITPIIAGAILILPMAVVAFILNRLLVFKKAADPETITEEGKEEP